METIEYTCADGVATIALNRPEARNALGAPVVAELDALLGQITRDDTVRAVILTGRGGVFCAGGDVRSMHAAPRSAQTWRAGMRRAHRIVRALHGLDRPVIAAVDGAAFGAGFSLALLADIVLVSTRARFCMAFSRVGLVPDYGAMYTLPRSVGLQRAKELIFSAREVGAEEAVALGLALEMLEPQALMDRAKALALSLAGASAEALAVAKDGLQASLGSDLETMLQIEASGQGIAGTAEHALDAFGRFARKEPPRFQWPAAPAAKG
ncbi:MAG: enoyl-CoA hydratase/isomerase family protein [Rhodoferax sp.]|jgi:2-(1,2-epoxy-1,2-dihydrophenyl)acetyl-CoA isomerase|nr:enoyl-CoA hydratase/isomerase family protein [Rhodoferax sp.]